MRAHRHHQYTAFAVDPRLDQGLRRLVLLGLVTVLLFPAARGFSVWLGWIPLWLFAMPLTGWWALHRFRLPHWPKTHTALVHRRRRGRAQARRSGAQELPKRLAHAA